MPQQPIHPLTQQLAAAFDIVRDQFPGDLRMFCHVSRNGDNRTVITIQVNKFNLYGEDTKVEGSDLYAVLKELAHRLHFEEEQKQILLPPATPDDLPNPEPVRPTRLDDEISF